MEAGAAPETRFCGECGRERPIDEFARFDAYLVCPDCKQAYAQKLREGAAPVAAMGAVEYGGFWRRFVASLIDGIITGVVSSMVQTLLLAPWIQESAQISPNAAPAAVLGSALRVLGLSALVSLLISGLYEVFFISFMSATPGKMALGLKVLRANGGRVTVGRATGRYFAKILSSLILMIGYLLAAFDSEKRALHDMICDTRVIRRES